MISGPTTRYNLTDSTDVPVFEIVLGVDVNRCRFAVRHILRYDPNEPWELDDYIHLEIDGDGLINILPPGGPRTGPEIVGVAGLTAHVLLLWHCLHKTYAVLGCLDPDTDDDDVAGMRLVESPVHPMQPH